MKHSRSSNNLTIMLGIATVCLSLTLIKEKTEGTKIINNDNVRIEYTKLDKNNYNLIIQTKNDTNIQAKTNLEVGQNYGSLYLEGKSLNYYRKVWKKFSSPFIEERLYFKTPLEQIIDIETVLVPFYRGAVVFLLVLHH